MSKFKVTVKDENGSVVYDETIEANTPQEACGKAAEDANTAAAASSVSGASVSVSGSSASTNPGFILGGGAHGGSTLGGKDKLG